MKLIMALTYKIKLTHNINSPTQPNPIKSKMATRPIKSTKNCTSTINQSSPEGQRQLSETLRIGGDSFSKMKQAVLTKLLVKVTIERSIGAVQVVMSPEDTVWDLIKSTVQIYVKEKRRPLLIVTDPELFQLHYSQFTFECLKQEEKLVNLGSRNFFLCSKPSNSSYNQVIDISQQKLLLPGQS